MRRERLASGNSKRISAMIEILHRETGAVVLAVDGERRSHYAFMDGIGLRGQCLADPGFARMRGAKSIYTMT